MAAMVGLFILVLLIFLLLLEVPVASALGFTALAALALFDPGRLWAMPQTFFAAMKPFNLIAIPFFIVAGILLGRSGISRRLVNLANCLVGHRAGGLGVVTVVVSIFFAGISGSGPADVAALGLILIPAMVEAGFPRSFSAALMAAGGGIGIIVPPSIALILYGVVAQDFAPTVSISALFIAGIIPGIIVGLSLILYILLFQRRTQQSGASQKEHSARSMPLGKAFREAFWGLLAPVIIIGGIYSGVFSPTEAAAVVVVYALAVDVLVYRELRWKDLLSALCEAGATSGNVMFIVASASLLAWVLNWFDVVQEASEILLSLHMHKWITLLLMNAIVLVAGCVLDAISIMYLLMPILIPVAQKLGVDPNHFGIIVVVNLAIGQITPPVGVNLFVACGVSRTGLGEISRAVWPLIAAEVAALLLITFMPALSLALPELLLLP